MATVTITGDQGWGQYRPGSLPDGTIVDATAATFHQNNGAYDGHPNVRAYPVLIENAPNVVVLGGTILGETNQTEAWRTVYDWGNSAALNTKDSPGAQIKGWVIIQPWDGIRHSSGANYLIEDCYIKNSRDDAIEADDGESGIIRDCLIDDCFVGISTGDGDVNNSDELVHFDGVFMSQKKYLYNGNITHGPCFKMAHKSDTGGVEFNPEMKFTYCVVAISDTGHFGDQRVAHAWELMTEDSTDNYYLNLTDTPLSGSYPKPPFGWMVIEGEMARKYWKQCRRNWLERHGLEEFL